jgi:vacuolar-type H+-ATPase subunit I/STV1
LFETVTLFSNEAKKAKFRKLPSGKFDVTLYLEATKIKTDTLGIKANVLLNDYIEVGVLDKNENPIYLTKHKFTKSAETLTFTVGKEPYFGAIDPRHLLIDQIWRDNKIKFNVSK